MTRKPYVGSGRTVQANAKTATHKQDFNAHYQGGGFFHNADQINMNPSLSGGLAADNVQTTLEKFENYLVGLCVVTIGDGYTTTGDFTVNTVTTPTVEDAFSQALATTRLSNGGWILMKSGKYDFSDTVTLPPGISIMGSVGGTILNAASGLVGSAKPMFSVDASTSYQFGVKTSIPITEYTSDGYFKNKFVNLTFTDNMDNITTYQPAIDGSTAAFIRVRYDSYVEVEKCTVLGKTKYGTTSVNSLATSNFVKLIDTSVPTYGNTLKIHDCVIQGVEKVVDFACNTVVENQFTFTNNRVWFFDTSTSTNNYAVTFNACNSKLSGNIFKFTPINSSNLTVVPVCFEVNGTPSNVANIAVENNILTSGFNNTDETNQLLRFDSPYSTVSGQNKRFSIHGNLTGNVGDVEWYLVVGDGENSIGDINGAKALNYLSNIYSNVFNASIPTTVNYNDQITVYIRPGFYIIDSGWNSNGLGTKLIGLVENGNIPRIQIYNPTNATPAGITLDSSATNVLLGTHLENLNIQHRTGSYIRLVSLVGLNNPASYESYSERYTVKNCTFLNCGLYPRTVSSFTNRVKQAVLTIDECRFYTFTGYDYYHSIVVDQSLVDISIKNCVWERSDGTYDFRGYVITNATGWNASEIYASNIIIDNCDITISSANGANYLGVVAAPIQLNNIKNLILTNSYIDISATSADFSYILSTENSSSTGPESTINIFNNTFIGTNGTKYASATFPQMCLYISHNYNRLNISNNTFEDNPFGIFIDHVNDSGTLNSYTAVLTENVYKSNTKGDIFLYCNAGVTIDPGNYIINDNILDYNSQIESSVLDGSSLFSSVASLSGAINIISTIGTNENRVQIKSNNIQDYKTSSTLSNPQAAIFINGIKTTDISDNTIAFVDILAHDTYAIALRVYLLSGMSYVASTINHSTAKINNNYIKATSIDINSTCIPIHVTNYNYINIVGNTIIGHTRVTTYIVTYSNPTYTKLMDGIIRDNIFDESLHYDISVNGLTGTINYEAFIEEIILHDTTTTFDTRIAAYNNKNQKAIIDVNCTDFKTYGYEELDGYRGPMIMMSNRVMLSAARSNNKNRTRGQQILGTAITLAGLGNEVTSTEWSDLPYGLYITNAWRNNGRNSDDPMVETLTVPPNNHYKNQLIIPIDLPYGSEIIGIDIPIYYYNIQSLTPPDGYVTVTASASLVFGNVVDDGTISTGSGYIYIPDGSFDPPFALNTTVIGPDESASIRLTNDILNASNNKYKNEAWMNRAPSGGGDYYGIPRPNAYILLSMDRAVDINVPEYERSLLFAIPYARVIVRY